MPEDRRDRDYLGDILEAIQKILDYTNGQSYEQFLVDPRTQDAVVRNLEVIGEASKLISAQIRKQYPQVPWKEMAGTRDRLIHHYFGIAGTLSGKSLRRSCPLCFRSLNLS